MFDLVLEFGGVVMRGQPQIFQSQKRFEAALLLTAFVSSPLRGFGSLVRFFWASKRNEQRNLLLKESKIKLEQLNATNKLKIKFSLGR
jgi:hypothetical protein